MAYSKIRLNVGQMVVGFPSPTFLRRRQIAADRFAEGVEGVGLNWEQFTKARNERSTARHKEMTMS